MKYLSLCSGIEAATQAWHPLGWTPVAFSEIEKFPSAVLAHHYPDVPNWGDMTKFQEWPDACTCPSQHDGKQEQCSGRSGLGGIHAERDARSRRARSSDLPENARCEGCGNATIDLLVGGTPCQSFSVAGLRKGLDDPRGNLALTYLAIAERYRPRWLVWENVPGVLSSGGGRDFGSFLGAMGQLGYGFAYRVLDAQYVRTRRFGRAVPQRRRRVFVVGHIGDWRRAAAVLFDAESLRGNPPPRREAGEVASTIPSRSTAGGGLGTDFDCDGGTVAAHSIRADAMREGVAKTPSADAEGRVRLRNPGTGRGTPIVPFEVCGALSDGAHMGGGLNGQDAYTGRVLPVAFAENSRAEVRLCGGNGSVSAQLTTGGGKPGQGQPCIAFAHQAAGKQTTLGASDDGTCQTLSANQTPAVAFDPGQSANQKACFQISNEHSAPLPAGQGAAGRMAVASQMAVRRLTSVECSRLQAFPDDYLELKYANAEEAHAAQILHELWREIGAKGVAAEEAGFKENGESELREKRRIASTLFTPEILLSGVFLGWISWHQAWKSAERQNVSNVGQAGWSEGLVQGLRERWGAGCSPYRRKSFEQLAGQLGQPVSKLPYEAAQARAALRSSEMWAEAQRAWPLRYAFATEKERRSSRSINPDGPRYKALGNSMAVNVMEWIGERIEAMDGLV